MEILNIEEQLRQEQLILERGKEGMAVFLNRLTEAAEKMQGDYDKCDFSTQDGIIKAIRIQMFRDIVQKEIPRIMENIMNVDRGEKDRWNFWKWLKRNKSR